MNRTAIAGVILILLGVAALAYQGFTYTSRETVLEVGPVHATADHQKTVPIPPILGLAALAGGIALVIVGIRRPA